MLGSLWVFICRVLYGEVFPKRSAARPNSASEGEGINGYCEGGGNCQFTISLWMWIPRRLWSSLDLDPSLSRHSASVLPPRLRQSFCINAQYVVLQDSSFHVSKKKFWLYTLFIVPDRETNRTRDVGEFRDATTNLSALPVSTVS